MYWKLPFRGGAVEGNLRPQAVIAWSRVKQSFVPGKRTFCISLCFRIGDAASGHKQSSGSPIAFASPVDFSLFRAA